MPALPLRIRQARRGVALTQEALARLVGVNRSAVAQWERKGGCRPTSHNLAQIALVTHVSFDWLATGRGKMANGEPEGGDCAVELEARLVAAFRAMTPAGQRALVDLLADRHDASR
jgi:transcriptional regulator with XRE-family HTH domain